MTETIHGTPPRAQNQHLSMISALPRPSMRAVHRTLLRLVREAGEMSVDELVRAIAGYPRPLSAIMALVDAGLIEMDLRGAFDEATRLRPTSL